MATTRISSLHPLDATQWRQLLRATLRECTYLPDPIARSYMRNHVMDRYRRARRSDRPESQMIQAAKRGLSILQRANEGYPRPFDKVMFMSYGRIGKRRHELLVKMLKPPIPRNSHALRSLIAQNAQSAEFQDGWEPPEIMVSLIKSQMNHAVFTSSRIRPQLKGAGPVIPATNTWGTPVSPSRRFNIRRKWFNGTMGSLLPPLPEKDLQTLDGLISGSVPWVPVKRRKAPSTAPQDQDLILGFLADGPQKGLTFREYVDGRPHQITSRFMRRQWRRISSLVPRRYQNPHSGKCQFVWDTPKSMPQLAFSLKAEVDLDDIFDQSNEAKTSPKSQ
ncbi:uncharacterized protein N7459_008542 [Penicillium hispanicum]|uniref:uncharacterized protein n=1 Tax=Penicillium hispanicum TaxID=1080232 RepID=UPI0025401476|nr:uncharacterized protein N7459_008542 [Penicillium hispanicum]KAJ5574115.1 hypothetical protein N7459_008542 [Penicillium hispanicum]